MSLAAGCGVANLTPERELPNYNGSMLARGQGDSDLLCHAVVFSDGATDAVIVSCDTTCMDRQLILRIREEIERRIGIPGKHALISATHTHACPTVAPTFLAGALPDPVYVDFFVDRTLEAVRAAKAACRPAVLVAGQCPTPGFEFNRRFLRADGTVTLHPGVGSGLPPAGPVDRTMQFLAFEEPSGDPIAVAVNYPCHNNCCSGSYHRDLGGRGGDALRERLGRNVATPFLPAPCGDVIWCDRLRRQDARGDELSWQIGRGIAGGVAAAMDSAPRRSEVELCVRSEVIDIPDRPLAESTFCRDRCRGESDEAWAFARRRYDLEEEAVAARGETTCPVEIQAISLGKQVVIVTNPAELFVEFGIEIKVRSPFEVTLVSELTNGYCGYVPTEAAFPQKGYETHRTLYTSRLAKDGGRQITERSLAMLHAVQCGDGAEARSIGAREPC